MTIGLDGHGDEVGIIERARAALEGSVVERPVRRPQVPDQPAEFAPVRIETGPPTLALKIILVPEAALLLRRNRHARLRDVFHVVAVAGDEAAHALGPERGDDAGGAAA